MGGWGRRRKAERVSFKRGVPEGGLILCVSGLSGRVALVRKSFPGSLAFSSLHLKPWLLLRSRNHTSTQQTGSGCTGRRWPLAPSEPRPAALLARASGGGGKVAAGSPALSPPAFLRSFRGVCGRERSPRRRRAAAAPASPTSRPQRSTKFPASRPGWLRSAEPGGPGQKEEWVGLLGLLATPSADAASVKRTLESCCRRTCAGISTVGDPGAGGSGLREMRGDPVGW